MQTRILVAAAAFALTAKALQEPSVAKGGALDFSKHGGFAVAIRGFPAANQGAQGSVAFGGALDFSKSSKQNKRSAPSSTSEEDLPWIPEWTAGATVVGEEQEEPALTVAVPTSSVLANDQDVSISSPSGGAISTPIVGSASIATFIAQSLTISTFNTVPTNSISQAVQPSDVLSQASIVSVSSIDESSPSSPVPKAQVSTAQGTISIPALASISTKTGANPSITSPGSGITPAPASGTNGCLTFKIINSMTTDITISYQLGTYSPIGGIATVASSLIGPSATTGTFSKETTVVAPVGWAGRMTIGRAGAPLDYRGTKIEGNNGFDGADPNADPDPDVDISYVDGYSVPASCSCGDDVITGCNKELFDTGIKCDNLVGDADHPVCANDPRNIHGPANPFFVPCQHAAYAYDYDDVANWQGSCASNTITCCIGTNCPAPTRQPEANSKRELMALLTARKRAKGALAA